MAASRRWAVAIVLVGAAILIAGSGSGGFAQQSGDSVIDSYTVTNDTDLWMYTSHARSFQAKTLSLNVLIYGNPAVVETHFRELSRGEWNETTEETEDVGPVERPPNGTRTAWAAADGATRYAYVSNNGSGRWLTESYQLHDGDYFGSRHHVRAYESPYEGEQWVALQAHREHWDWFRLRHTVDGVGISQAYVEQEFIDQWFVQELSRIYVGEDLGSNGWITVVDFEGPDATVAALVVLGVSAVRRVNRRISWRDARRSRAWRAGTLAAAVGGLYLSVRFGVIGLERLLPIVQPWFVAAAFYPALFAGLPVCAALFGRRLDQLRAFATASLGFALALLIDYSYLQVRVLPLDTLVHRLTLVLALGLLAAGVPRFGAAESEYHGYFRLGVLLWLVAMGLPLLRAVV